MKQADVVVGETYLTYIGNNLQVVKVTEKVFMINHTSKRRAGLRFRVCRPGGKPLPKDRTAAALRKRSSKRKSE